MAGWLDRREEMLAALRVAADEAGLGQQFREIEAAVQRAPPPPEDTRAEQTRFIATYFRRFCAQLSGRAAVRALQLETSRYERTAFKVDCRAPGPPQAIRGTEREFIWEIRTRGYLPSERTLRTIHMKSLRKSGQIEI